MYDYKSLTDGLVTSRIITRDDIYDYSNDDLAIVFDRYFQYCQTALTENSKDFDIQPAKFYFRNDFSINAAAGKIADHYILRVNMGLIVKLYNQFHQNNALFEQPETIEQYRTLISSFDTPVGYIMFQLASYMTFYHEQGHLFQRSPLLSQFLTEYNSAPSEDNYSSLKHCLEFDADLHASHCLIFVLEGFWKKQPENFQTSDYANELLALALGSMFIYLMLLEEGNSEIYYKKGTHPHPTVRITYMLDAMVRIAEINFEGAVIDDGKILKQALAIATAYSEAGQQRDIVQAYARTLSAEYANIKDFIENVLIPESDALPYLVKNRP